MVKNIKIKISGEIQDVPFACTASTSIRYKQIFGSEAEKAIAKIIKVIASNPALIAAIKDGNGVSEDGVSEDVVSEDVVSEDVVSEDGVLMSPEYINAMALLLESGILQDLKQMAFVMSCQGSKKDMRLVTEDDYYEWLDKLEPLEIMNHLGELLDLFMADRTMTAVPKKNCESLLAKRLIQPCTS